MNRNEFKGVPDELWQKVEPLLPPAKAKDPKGRGRPRVSDRQIFAGILYRLRTGCQWKALPSDFGSGSTCHLRFQQWVEAGVFGEIFRQLLHHYDREVGIDWNWASLDGAMVKAPKGGTIREGTPQIEGNWG